MLTAAQREARTVGIGGSDAPVVLQLSPWKTPYELWTQKRAALDGAPPDPLRELKLADRPELKWGARLEGPILDAFAEESGIAVSDRNVQLRHPDIPFILGSLDGVAEDGCPVEAKTARSGDGWGEAGSAEIPIYYEPQVQQYLGLLPEARGAHVAVLIGGSDFRMYWVPRDEAMIADLFEAERRFWEDHVLAGVPPEPSTVMGLMHRYRFDDGSALEADVGLAQKVADLKELKHAQDRVEEQQEAIKAEIMAAMGPAQILTYDRRPIVTWRTAKGAMRFDVKGFAEFHPELLKRFTRPGEPSRRFLVK